jgi:hypothetical protein
MSDPGFGGLALSEPLFVLCPTEKCDQVLPGAELDPEIANPDLAQMLLIDRIAGVDGYLEIEPGDVQVEDRLTTSGSESQS